MRVDNSATQPKSPPAGSAGVAAMVMGATTHGRSATFFYQILINVKEFFSLPNCVHRPDQTFLNRPQFRPYQNTMATLTTRALSVQLEGVPVWVWVHPTMAH